MLATLLLSHGTPMLARRRRVRPHPERQQQRLLPGQRDRLARLGGIGADGASLRRIHAAADRLRNASRSCAAAASSPAPQRGARRQGRDLAGPDGARDDGRATGAMATRAARRAARRPRPGDRHPPARRRRHALLISQRLPRPRDSSRCPNRWAASPGRVLLDTNLPDSQELESFKVGERYDVTGRSMLMFVLKPEETHGEAVHRDGALLPARDAGIRAGQHRERALQPRPGRLGDPPGRRAGRLRKRRSVRELRRLVRRRAVGEQCAAARVRGVARDGQNSAG